MTFYITQNDTLPVLEATLCDAGGPWDVPDTATIQLHYQAADGTVRVKNATKVAGITGRVKYAWVVGDKPAGLYQGRFVVTLQSGDVITFPNKGYFRIEVAPSF